MAYHRFRIGETVSASAMGVPRGPYRITRLLPPSDNGVPNYRAKNIETDLERALAEDALRPWSDEATTISKTKGAPPDRPEVTERSAGTHKRTSREHQAAFGRLSDAILSGRNL